jgi:hypothetical protein
VGRALTELRIEHIPLQPGSPRPHGAGVWHLQQRLPPVLRLAGITTIAAANRYLAEIYLPAHNARFAVAPAEEGSAFRHSRPARGTSCASSTNASWVATIACVTTGGSYRPRAAHRRHFVKVAVQVREYPDGSIAPFHGPRRLAGYTADGTLITEEKQTRSAA